MYKVGDKVKRLKTFSGQRVLAGTMGTVVEVGGKGVSVRWENVNYGSLSYAPDSYDIALVSPSVVVRTVRLRSGDVDLREIGDDQIIVGTPGQVEATFDVEHLDDLIAVLTAFKEENK